VASWLAARLANQPTARYFGELCGAFTGSTRPTNVWSYMYGPPPMMTALAEGFRVVGIPANQIRWEEFGPR
jgi:ferredoxin-NADP reductase